MDNRIPKKSQAAKRSSTGNPGRMANRNSQPPSITRPRNFISRRFQALREAMLRNRAGTTRRRRSGSQQMSGASNVRVRISQAMQRRYAETQRARMANMVPANTSAYRRSQPARRTTNVSQNSLQRAEGPRAPIVISPPEHTADNSKQPNVIQQCRATVLGNLLMEYNSSVIRRDSQVLNGTYDSNTEQNRINANNISSAIVLIRRLYRQFLAVSRRYNTEDVDSALLERVIATWITSNEETIMNVDPRASNSSSETEPSNEISSSNTERSNSTESEVAHAEGLPQVRRESNVNPIGDMRNTDPQGSSAQRMDEDSQNSGGLCHSTPQQNPKGSHAERPLHEEDNVDLVDEFRNLYGQPNNAVQMVCGGQCPCPTPQQLSEINAALKRMQSQYWAAAESLIQEFELELIINGIISQSEQSEITSNSVDQIQDILMQVGSNSSRNNSRITSRRAPEPQAGPSRIRQENPVPQIQDTSIYSGGNSSINNGPMTGSQSPEPQAGPSRIRQENPKSPIQDSSNEDKGNDYGNNDTIQDCERSAQQAGPSHIQDEDPAARVNFLRNYQPSLDPDLVPIGNGNAMVPRSVLDNIDWEVYTTATRQLLQAIFPRSVLATHSLTGKQSPAFLDRPAKKILDPKLVEDIILIVSENSEVPRNLVRSCITIKCTDEAKMYRNRQRQREKLKMQKENKPPSSENKPPSSENEPPPSPSDS